MMMQWSSSLHRSNLDTIESKVREKVFLVCYHAATQPRTIDSNPLEGGIGVFQRGYSEGCFFPNLSH